MFANSFFVGFLIGVDLLIVILIPLKPLLRLNAVMGSNDRARRNLITGSNEQLGDLALVPEGCGWKASHHVPASNSKRGFRLGYS